MDAESTYQVFDWLWTSGQLSADDIARLPELGVRNVINLALPSSTYALKGEAELVTIDSLTAQKRLIEANFGIGLLPSSSIDEELRLGTLSRLDGPALTAAIPVVAVHRRSGYLSGAAKRLLSALTDEVPRAPR